MRRRLALIGAPTSAGAYAPGQEKAPTAFRAHGIADAMRRAGWHVRDLGDVEGFRWRPDPSRPNAMNLEAVASVARRVSERVAEALQARELALVLGGDCTIELGSVAGALRESESVGLIYIDLDTDLNPPDASDGALDWTGVAHLLDVDGAASEMSAIGPRRPLLSAKDVLYLGVDPSTQTPVEKATVETHGLRIIELDEVHRNAAAVVRHAVEWAGSFERLAMHVDVDVLSFSGFPVAENVRRQDGLTLSELTDLMRGIFAASNVSTLTVTEVNPDHAPEERETFTALISALANVITV